MTRDEQPPWIVALAENLIPAGQILLPGRRVRLLSPLFIDEPAIGVEQRFRFVGAQPRLELGQVLRIVADLGHRYLV